MVQVKRVGLVLALGLAVSVAMVFASGQSGGGQSAASGPAKITVEVFDRGTDGGRSDPTNNNWTKWIQEKLLKDENIAVTFVAVPRSQEVAALNTMMAAGNAPDVSFTYDANLVDTFRMQGGLYEMSSNVDRLMPDLKAWLGADESLPGRLLINRLETSDGKLYAVPARRMAGGLAMRGAFMRKDWLDKLGLAPPKTIDEFYAALKAFKEKDPGNVGNVIPLVDRGTMDDLAASMQGAFMDPNLSSKDRWINGDVMQPGYKETIRTLNKWYNEGLIDKDFPLYNDGGTTVYNLLMSGQAGFYVADRDHPYRNTPGIEDAIRKNISGASFIPIDPFVNSQGKTPKYIYDPVGIYNFVPIFSKAPEAAMRYLNWITKFENRYFIQVGPEGIVHDVVNGIPQIKAGAGLWIQNSDQNLDYTLTINGLDFGDPEKNQYAIANAFNADYRNLVNLAYELSLKDGFAPPVVAGVELVEGLKYPGLTEKLSDLRIRAITCPVAQFDRTWDDGIRDYLASGGQAIIDEKKAKYPY
jgi:putative aldouronate transport system substrate-binding protein